MHEDFTHVLRCKHDTNIKAITAATEKLRQRLNADHVSAPMIQALLHGIHQWLYDNPFDTDIIEASDTKQTLILSAIKSQNRIGWDHLLRGRISTEWVTANTRYITERYEREDKQVINVNFKQVCEVRLVDLV